MVIVVFEGSGQELAGKQSKRVSANHTPDKREIQVGDFQQERKDHIRAFTDESGPGTPRNVCSIYVEMPQKPDKTDVNIKKTLCRNLIFILKSGDFEGMQQNLHFFRTKVKMVTPFLGFCFPQKCGVQGDTKSRKSPEITK